jgi:hypothetical protein
MAEFKQPLTVIRYDARGALARKSQAIHMLLALGPLIVAIWGPKIAWVQLASFSAFGLVGAHAVYRQFKIDRCPACDAPRFFQRYHRDLDPRYCYNCGVQLIMIPDAS